MKPEKVLTSAQRLCGVRNLSSVRQPILFIPNEDKYRFEGENLSSEQNRNAIRKKPTLGQVHSLFQNIEPPSNVADALLYPSFTDTITTLFAKNKPFSGDLSYNVTLKDKPSQPVEIHFENLTIDWISEFKAQIIELAEIPSDSSLEVKKLVDERVVLAVKELSNDLFQISEENIESLISHLGIEKGYRRHLDSALYYSELQNFLTVEKVFQYLLDISSSGQDIKAILLCAERHFVNFTPAGLFEILSTVAEDVSNLSDTIKLEAFLKFVRNSGVFESFQNLLIDQESTSLDRLAFVLFLANEIEKGLVISQELVNERQHSTSKKTFDAFIKAAREHLSTVDKKVQKERFSQIFSPLKPVLFHRFIDSNTANLILDVGITTSYELSHFISLLKRKSQETLVTLHSEIIQKLIKINSLKSEEMKALEMSLLLRQLMIDNLIDLEREKPQLKEYYGNLGYTF